MSRESDLRQLQERATQAYQRGQPVFVARFRTGIFGIPGHEEMVAWSESLHAVESVGWVLDQWSTSADSSGGFNAFPVFRRSQPWSPSAAPQDSIQP